MVVAELALVAVRAEPDRIVVVESEPPPLRIGWQPDSVALDTPGCDRYVRLHAFESMPGRYQGYKRGRAVPVIDSCALAADEREVSVNDGNSLPVRGVYGALRLSLRAREVMRAVRGVRALTVATIVLVGLAATFHSYWLVAVLAVVLMLNAGQWIYFRYFLARAGLEGVDEMTGWEFERWLERLFLRLGFEVERTPFRGDYGADFVLTWSGMRIAVQAKRSSRLVGVRAIQEVVAARAFYGCERTMVVTNSYFTDQAMLLARSNGVRIRHRDDLARVLAGL